MAITDLEKNRSQFAYGCVNDVWSVYLEAYKKTKDISCKEKKLDNNQKKLCKDTEDKYKLANNYKSYVKKVPMMILNNGLGATFAFVYSKKKSGNAYELIYTQTTKWLKADKNLVEWIINQESQEYRATTNEVLALFGWLKRFADGMIEGEDNE